MPRRRSPQPRSRRSYEISYGGAIRFPDAGEPLLAFKRKDDKERLLAVFNRGGAYASYPLAKGVRLMPLTGHGLGGYLDSNGIGSAGHDAFFVSVDKGGYNNG